MAGLLIRNKKGLMDDFTDLLSFVLILSMLGFFSMIILRTDAGDKAEQSLDRIALFHDQEALQDLINAPTLLDNQKVEVKDVIILAVNKNNKTFFAEEMQTFFEQQHFEGGIVVYDSSYVTGVEQEPLLSYNNVVFLGEEKGALYLTNVYGEGNKKLIVVKLFG